MRQLSQRKARATSFSSWNHNPIMRLALLPISCFMDLWSPTPWSARKCMCKHHKPLSTFFFLLSFSLFIKKFAYKLFPKRSLFYSPSISPKHSQLLIPNPYLFLFKYFLFIYDLEVGDSHEKQAINEIYIFL